MTEAYIAQIQSLMTDLISGFEAIMNSAQLTARTRQQMMDALVDLRVKRDTFIKRLRECQIDRLVTGADGQKLLAELRRVSAQLLGRGYTTAEVDRLPRDSREQLAQSSRQILARDSQLFEEYERLRDSVQKTADQSRKVANAGVVWQDQLVGPPSNLSSGDVWTGPSGQRYLVQDDYQVCLGDWCTPETWTTTPYKGYRLDLPGSSFYVPSGYYLDPVVETYPWITQYYM